MKTQTKRVLLALLVLAFITISIFAWGTVRLVSWARDLPGRIHVDTSGMGQAFGQIIVSSYHEALDRGDVKTQQNILQGFLELCDTEPASCEWIRREFSAEIASLTASPDTAIASAASQLLERIHEGTSPKLQ